MQVLYDAQSMVAGKLPMQCWKIVAVTSDRIIDIAAVLFEISQHRPTASS